MDRNLVFTGVDCKDNWLWNEWYMAGTNSRYPTWQLVFNILSQRPNPAATFFETGCQRHEKDIGDGASTTLFCEYVSRYGGKVISVDIDRRNVDMALAWTKKYNIDRSIICMDSLKFLSTFDEPCDLVYLDSYDYPLEPCPERDTSQKHNLAELELIYDKLKHDTILLFDDNQLPGGGKPKLSKEYLAERGWVCLFDYQQSVWVRSL